jgi:MFS family permease
MRNMASASETTLHSLMQLEQPSNRFDAESKPRNVENGSATPSEIQNDRSPAVPVDGTEKPAEPEATDPMPSTDANTNTRSVTGFRWALIVASLLVGCFFYGLDTTIAAAVQGEVVEAFGRVDALAWIGAGFPMGSVAIILLLGALFKSFNKKWIWFTTFVLFLAGSALCGAARNMPAMIVGRVVAGCGGSGIYLGALEYFTALTLPTERAMYIGLIAITWGTGSVLGPIVGGAFSVSSATWRWSFYINLVIGAAILPAAVFLLPGLHPVTGVPVRRSLARLDFVGFTLNAATWILFTIALTMPGGQWPWRDYRTILTFVFFGLVLAAYIIQQYFRLFTTPETQTFPVKLLQSRIQILLYIATSANITMLFVVVYFVPVYFQFVHNDTALMAAVRLLPYIVICVVFNLAIGAFMPRLQYYMPVFVVSGVLMTVGGALLTAYLGRVDLPVSYIYGFTVIVAVGTGLTLQIGYTVATMKVSSPSDIGKALALQNVSQIGGTVIALVIAGQVFQSTAVKNLEQVLSGLGYSQGDIHAAVAGAQSELFTTIGGELRDRAVEAVTGAIQRTFALTVVAGGVLTLAGLGMRVERLFG